MSVFIGIDVGTQSVKVVAYDVDRRRVAQAASAALELISRDDGSREQLAQWWIDALRQCLLSLDSAVRSRVAGLGVSGQQHGFVALDRDGDVLSPVKLWCDTSTVAECDEITAAAGGEKRCIEIAGNPILPGYTASKVRWLKKSRPQAYSRLSTILLPHDYVNFYLTGERFTECGDASGSGWFDVRARTWSRRMLAAMDDDRDLLGCMPQLLQPDAAVPLSPRVAEEIGLPRTALVSVGGGDNMMAAIGTRNVRAGRLTLSLGTSGTLFAFAESPIVDAGGDVAAFCSSSGGWLPLVCTMNCTVATEQVRRLANIQLADTERMLAGTEPGSEGVMTLPFYNGERTPNLPRAKASIVGLDIQNMRPANLLRSAMEGATCGLRHGLETFARLGLNFQSVCLTGGGAASATWRQMVADFFALPVVVLQQHESAALGAALQAACTQQRAQGASQSLQDLVDDHLLFDGGVCCTPDAQASRIYDDIYARYVEQLAHLQH